MSTFTPTQTEQLLKPINPKRVLRDGKGHSHVSQQDITAHLIRVFGFGGFDFEVIETECLFREERADKKTGELTGRWDVCWRALMRLTVRFPDGTVCQYEDGSTATAQNQSRGDAEDLAYKSAISLSKKRCAINLGDQFGLSLYNKGQMTALVGATIAGAEEAPEDVQAGVPQQVSLGNDETAHEGFVDVGPWLDQIADAQTAEELAVIGQAASRAGLSPEDAKRVYAAWTERKKAVAA